MKTALEALQCLRSKGVHPVDALTLVLSFPALSREQRRNRSLTLEVLEVRLDLGSCGQIAREQCGGSVSTCCRPQGMAGA